jgi:hypothetical protein
MRPSKRRRLAIVATDLLALTSSRSRAPWGRTRLGSASASASHGLRRARTPPSCPARTRSSAPCPGASSACPSTRAATAPTASPSRRGAAHPAREGDSNVCTAQALLRYGPMYAVFHGPKGLAPSRARPRPDPAPRPRLRAPAHGSSPSISSTRHRRGRRGPGGIFAERAGRGLNFRRIGPTASASPRREHGRGSPRILRAFGIERRPHLAASGIPESLLRQSDYPEPSRVPHETGPRPR